MTKVNAVIVRNNFDIVTVTRSAVGAWMRDSGGGAGIDYSI